MTATNDLTAQALSSAYRQKQLSPVEVVRAALARIEAWEGRINAIYVVDAAGALGLLKNPGGFGELLGLQAVPEQKLGVTHDGGERIIELVSDTGNELAERGHFFRLDHLLGNILSGGDLRGGD